MPDAPTPRRIVRPRWFDVRVIGGVLLLVASVVLGAKVIGAASHTDPVWAASRSLAAGTVLSETDLVETSVNLGSHTGGYLAADAEVTGRMITRPLGAGELIPAAALEPVTDVRIVAVTVAPDNMAPGVDHGALIDLYLITGTSAVVDREITTELLFSSLTVQSVRAPASGGLSGAVGRTYQLAVLLPPADADALVRRLPQGEALVVLHGGDGGSADRGGRSGTMAAAGTDDGMAEGS